jgi:hypothetical protein
LTTTEWPLLWMALSVYMGVKSHGAIGVVCLYTSVVLDLRPLFQIAELIYDTFEKIESSMPRGEQGISAYRHWCRGNNVAFHVKPYQSKTSMTTLLLLLRHQLLSIQLL